MLILEHFGDGHLQWRLFPSSNSKYQYLKFILESRDIRSWEIRNHKRVTRQVARIRKNESAMDTSCSSV
jgi:hypothetical protein